MVEVVSKEEVEEGGLEIGVVSEGGGLKSGEEESGVKEGRMRAMEGRKGGRVSSSRRRKVLES